MICIECGYPEIDCLYSRYKSEYIKLTVCPKCNKIADKYIEYDSVILFLDILLLKKQAYRHLSYNVTEQEVITSTHSAHNYTKIIRMFLLILSLEVYLTWANEEISPVHSKFINLVLTRGIMFQYLFFIVKLGVENVVLNASLQVVLRVWLKWGQTRREVNGNIPEGAVFAYKTVVLLVTTMVSGSIKLFPILMFIWPYDNLAITKKFIKSIAFFNIVEAVKIVTGYGGLECGVGEVVEVFLAV
ncbi:Protein ARV1 [Candida viswanathii]|uniref:Protein ARV n=1 Tax=Candida viswanathii TaxID=5486 RepID=A0A367XVD0_9ASCO|nr:Protein ARV1 [Candida viswanathii]